MRCQCHQRQATISSLSIPNLHATFSLTPTDHFFPYTCPVVFCKVYEGCWILRIFSWPSLWSCNLCILFESALEHLLRNVRGIFREGFYFFAQISPAYCSINLDSELCFHGAHFPLGWRLMILVYLILIFLLDP